MAARKKPNYNPKGGIRSASLDPEYKLILEYAQTEGYALPSSDQNVQNSAVMTNLKEIGAWDLIDVLYYWKLEAGLEDFARINWKDPNSFEGYGTSLPTLTAGVGLTGNGTDQVFRTSWQPATDGVNFVLGSMAIGYETVGGNYSGSPWGCRTNSANNLYPNGATTYLNGGSTGGIGGGEIHDNHALHTKTGTTQRRHVGGIFTQDYAYPNGSVTNVEMVIFARNLNGALSQFYNRTLTHWYAGGFGLDPMAADIMAIIDGTY